MVDSPSDAPHHPFACPIRRSAPSPVRLLGVLALAAAPLAPIPAAAQGLGSAVIFGQVTSESGEPLPSVSVELRHLPTGVTARVVTNAQGRYLLANLRPGGPYELRVGSAGYVWAERSDLRLEAEQRLSLDFTLAAQVFLLEGVGVTLDRRFEVSRTGPAVTVTREAIEVHPTIARNVLELATLSPVVAQTGDQGGLSISGQNERQNSILIDGALNQDVFGASVSGVPGAAARAKPIPLEAIEEFRVEAAPFDARTSGFTGGSLNAITRSGTNRWEASAFSQYRNERFFSGLAFDGAEVAPEAYSRHAWGFSVGGPLEEDRVHLFLATEFESLREPAPGFSLGVHDPIRTRVAPDSVARLSQILREGYGVDGGTSGQVWLRNPLSNLFARLDWQVGDAHTLTVRHNWSAAARDSTPNRSAFGPYELASAGYRIEASTHALSSRLVSRFGDGHSNELSVNVQRTRERADPVSRTPQVDVRVASTFDDVGFVRPIRAGSRYFSQDSALDQDILQLTQGVTLARDRIFTTLGVSLDHFTFRQRYNPGSLGYYRFDSLRELEANLPSYYEVNLPGPAGQEREIRFSVMNPALYAQQEHRLPDGLTLRYGVRWDVPVFPDTPGRNEAVEEAFGRRTDRLPSVKGFIAPRFGFNWQSDSRWRTQVRGGFGMFTGRLPYVWLANAFQYDGLRSRVIYCEGEAAPAYNPSAPAPASCAGGAQGRETGAVLLFRDDFRHPREFKLSWAFDQLLPGDLVLSLEGLLVTTHGRTVVRDINLPMPGVPEDAGHARAFGERAHYGTPLPYGYAPKRRIEGFGPVLEVGWEDRSARAWATTLQLERGFGEHFRVVASHTLSGSRDVQSLSQTDMLANIGATAIGFAATELTPSPANFDRPHKTVVNGVARLPRRFGGTEISLLYVGQSGAPYSYVYATDINGDGFSGPGLPLSAGNDLIWVPRQPADLPGTIVARSLFARFVDEVEPCLKGVRGEIMRRNSCRTPAVHMLDLRVIQPVEFRGTRLEVSADLLNVLNLLDRSRGLVWEVDPVIPLLEIVNRSDQGLTGPVPTSSPILGYAGGVARDAGSGQVRPTLPHTLVVPASQWQAQVGLRIRY